MVESQSSGIILQWGGENQLGLVFSVAHPVSSVLFKVLQSAGCEVLHCGI